MRCGRARGVVVVACQIFCCFAVCGQEPKEAGPPLPLKRVVLFSSSVGFFEHRGQIEGNRQIEFAFKAAEINDLLKSLVVQDRDDGLVTAVNYGSPEPLAKTLRTFAVDLTATPSLAQIFQQLRGRQVMVEMPAEVKGVVIGVENRRLVLGDQGIADCEMLNLRTERGLESVRIDSITRTQLLDPKVDAEFQQALELLAQPHATEHKRVKLDFRGAGERRVAVGYIQEAPVWKTSYRLVLREGEAPFLQGWAIVENTTAQDWRDVQLTLVSGRPISFLMDLAEPLFMSRPFVKPEQHAALRPRVYDQDMGARAREFERAGEQAAMGRRRGAMGGGMGGGMGGMGGGMGGMGGGMTPRGRMAEGGGMFGGGLGGAAPTIDPFPDPNSAAGAAPSNIDLRQGVSTAASAEDVGELFRYVITAPVTLGRNESAMLPIVNDTVKGEKVTIFNPAVHAKHPLTGLRLTNTTPLHLLQGPITVFDGGEYAGDARIEDMSPDTTRLVSYALDLETEIVMENKPAKQTIVSLQIKKGGLHVKHKATRVSEYLVKNSSSHTKQVIIERPVDSSWTIVDPLPVEKTRSLVRFSVDAEPGKPTWLVILEERDYAEDFILASLAPAHVEIFLRTSAASPALQKALKETLDRRTAVADIAIKRRAVDQQIAELIQEQSRVRSNAQGIPNVRSDEPAGSPNRKLAVELLERFLTKVSKLESDLEKAREGLETIKQEELRKTRELEDFLGKLVVE